jgi:uncharacterized protein YndB with AHSA1/START domain
MILRVLAVIAFLVAAVLLYAATKPNTVRIQRSIDIQAPPEKIFALIDDFHNWSLWAPQDREDPTMRRTYSGPASGIGAASEWSGTGQSGKGRMSITESVPPARVLVTADFTRPLQAHNLNEFVLESRGAQTHVTWTWTMQGRSLYVMNVMGIFMNMDKRMGKHFDTGLRDLKIAAER